VYPTPIRYTRRLEYHQKRKQPKGGSVISILAKDQNALTNSRKQSFHADDPKYSSEKKQQFLRNMQDYDQFPPIKYFIRTLKSCPKSALLYIQLWKNKDKNMSLVTDKGDIRKEYLISPTMFRNLLAPLMFLNLIHFVESEDKFRIDIMGQHLND